MLITFDKFSFYQNGGIVFYSNEFYPGEFIVTGLHP